MPNKELLDAPQIENIEFIEFLSINEHFRLFKARQQTLDRTVIIAITKASMKASEKMAQFQQLSSLYSNIHHPNIQQTISQGLCKDETPYLMMEFIEGNNLEVFLQSTELFSFKQFQNLFTPLLSALDYLHSTGIAFASISPENILISNEAGSIQAKFAGFSLLDGSSAKTDPAMASNSGIESNIYDISCLMYYSLLQKSTDKSFAQVQQQLRETPGGAGDKSKQLGIPVALTNALAAILERDSSKALKSAAELNSKITLALQDVTADRGPKLAQSPARKADPKLLLGIFILLTLMTISVINLGRFLHQEQSKKGEKEARETITEPPSVLLRKADTLALANKYREAVEACESALKKCTRKKDAQYIECERAVVSYSFLLVQKNPKVSDREVLLKRALTLASEAEALVSKRRDSESVLGCMDQEISILAELKGEQAAADFVEKTFDKYINIEPSPRVSKLLEFHETQIRHLLAAKRFKSAENKYEKLKQVFDKLQPPAELFIRLHLLHAEIEFRQMHFAKASKEAEKEASILISSGDISADERQKMWDSIQQILANEPGKIAKLMQVELDDNGYLYEKAPMTLGAYYFLLGQCYIVIGQSEKALTALEKGYKIAKDIKTEHITCRNILESLCRLPLPEQKKKLYQTELAKLPN